MDNFNWGVHFVGVGVETTGQKWVFIKTTCAMFLLKRSYIPLDTSYTAILIAVLTKDTGF